MNFKFHPDSIGTNFKLLSSFYLLIIVCLFFYSFTQVDLGLTLSRWSVWKAFQTFFQQIGYFNRPLSTLFYILILVFLFVFYLIFLHLVKQKAISNKQIWTVILATAAILVFSYNAFSYDLFNYIFDAKIIALYHQNPYEHKALDYPGDPLISFMHWTHRTYPYGPAWLVLTVPVYFLGNGWYLLTLVLFKLLAAVSYLGIGVFIGKILKKVSPENELFGITFFALSPLVLIEGLVSAHIDIVMMFFAVFSLWLLLSKKYFRSIFMFIVSILIKFGSAILFPVFGYIIFMSTKRKTIHWQTLLHICALLMIVPIILASVRTNFQPWYLLNVLPIAALLSYKKYVFVPGFIISFFSMLQYIPFLYTGNWNPPIPSILFWLTTTSVVLSVVFVAVAIKKKK